MKGELPLGLLCHDTGGNPWVYIGYRVTSIGTRSYNFVKCLAGEPGLSGIPFMYQASNLTTIERKFPGLHME